MDCSFSICAWGLANGKSLVWLGGAPLPSSEITLMGWCSQRLFTLFSSSLGKGMLPLNSISGFGFIFLWDVKGPRLLSRSEEAPVGGWQGGCMQ